MPDSRSVLVVDDEYDIRDGVTRWLKAAGYETVSASDGEEGLAAATENRPDAIIMDVMMPKVDGMTAMSQLKKDARTSTIPIVMLSASLRDEQRALDAGAKFFVQKPYDGRTLVSTVEASLQATA